MQVHSLAMKSRKRLACDIFAAFATHSSLFHDIADTDCRNFENGSLHTHLCFCNIQMSVSNNRTFKMTFTHSCVFATFKCQLLTTGPKTELKTHTNCHAMFFLFVPDACSLWFLFKKHPLAVSFEVSSSSS